MHDVDSALFLFQSRWLLAPFYVGLVIGLCVLLIHFVRELAIFVVKIGSLTDAERRTVVGAVVGEYLGSAKGVGYLILQAEGTFDVNTVFAGIVVLTAFALVLDGVVGRIEKRLMKWQPRSGETEKL